MVIDHWAVAKARNRAESIILQKQLNSLDRQKYQELILLDQQKKVYGKKISKISSKSYQYQNEFITCETQAPGLYGGSSEQTIKNPNSRFCMASSDYSGIRDMVFTNNVVDIEKLLVLHLLSVHKTETLVPAKRKLATAFKENAPTERLVEKSKRGFFIDETIMDLLPFYTVEYLEVGPDGEKRRQIINQDSRLCNRILFNRNLRKLIITVLSVLHKSNFAKFRKLIQLAHNPNKIRAILSTNSCKEFLDTLSDQNIVTNCENFTLTPPFKLKTRDLNVRTPSGSLENLLTDLRSKVLQIPVRTPLNIEEPKISFNKVLALRSSIFRNNPRTPRIIGSSMSNSDSTKFPQTGLFAKISKDINESDLKKSEKKSLRRVEIPNFVQKNIKEAGKTKKIEYDFDEDFTAPVLLDSRRPSSKNPVQKVDSTGYQASRFQENSQQFQQTSEEPESTASSLKSQSDGGKIFKNVPPEQRLNSQVFVENVDYTPHTVDLQIQDIQNKENRSVKDVSTHRKHHIKQTTCTACMEKWKTPLPIPKTPRIRKKSDPNNPPRTDSKNRIHTLINKELFTLESYDRKFSSSTSKPTIKKEEPTESEDNAIINPIYLAKIEQEIREKETQKKLEKFLNEPIEK